MADEDTKPAILILDDDASFCEALTRALERRGHTVHAALDTRTAWALAEQHAPPYAVVDLRLGEDSSLPFIQRLHQRDPDMRIVVLTGYASIATAVEAIKLGATHYLTKPAEPDQILAILADEQGNAEVPLTTEPMSVRRLEWEHIQKVLQEHDGNISAAARAMGMHRRTLQRKLQKRPTRR